MSALTGGITATLSGGKFGHGFFSAGAGAFIGTKIGGFVKGAGHAAKNIGKFLAKTTLGGALSKVSGGKFANGAGFAAFSAAVSYGMTLERSVSDAPRPNVQTSLTAPEVPEGDAVTYDSGGESYSKSAQQAPTNIDSRRLIHEVVVVGQRSSSSWDGYYHVPRCSSCFSPTYSAPVAPAFSTQRVNSLTIDIAKTTGRFMINTAAGATGIGAVRAGVGYLARRPETLSAVIRVGANALDEAGFVHDSIGTTSSGKPPIQYQHIVRDAATHIPK